MLRNEQRRDNNLVTNKNNNSINYTNNTNNVLSNKENRNSNNNEEKNKMERHIKLVGDTKNYSIKEDLNSSVSNITLGQLLDLSQN